MGEFVKKALEFALAFATSYPAAAKVIGLLGVAASVLLVLQPFLQRFVDSTEPKWDDKALSLALTIANALTPDGARPGEANVDARVVDKAIETYSDPSNVPEFVMLTMTQRQRDLLAKRYVEAAQK